MGLSDVPPAFRRIPKTPPYFIGLDDNQVLKIAQNALNLIQTLPIGSTARAAQWAEFDAAMGELAGRGIRQILAKIHERETGELPAAPRARVCATCCVY
jgi:hypothetical protein